MTQMRNRFDPTPGDAILELEELCAALSLKDTFTS